MHIDNLGGLTVILGRSLPYSRMKQNVAMDLMFAQNRKSILSGLMKLISLLICYPI